MYLSNLVVKPGQTDGFSVADHASEIERFAGGPILDYVLYNTAEAPTYLRRRYVSQGEVPVEVDPTQFVGKHYQALGYPLVATEAPVMQKGDALASHRSYIRHDSAAVAKAICDVYTISSKDKRSA
jgi:2-phospho-L-lactate transferase/gluconeogenesis factor (CofD/UPF0052 family)